MRRTFLIRHGAQAQSCGATRFTIFTPIGLNRADNGKFALGLSTGMWTAIGFARTHSTTRLCSARTSRTLVAPASPITPSSAVRPSMVAPAASIRGPPKATGSMSGYSARNRAITGAAWASPDGSCAVNSTTFRFASRDPDSMGEDYRIQSIAALATVFAPIQTLYHSHLLMLKRSHMCGSLRANLVGQTITVCGWINTYRDQGKGLIFADVRDREGLCQVVFDLEQSPADLVGLAKTLRREFVIAVTGKVRIRAGAANPKLATGEIEIVAEKLELLNAAEPPPILPDDHDAEKIGEEIRLKYRYIDLRRPRMQSILRTRSRVTKFARDYFGSNGFLEIETPLLIKTTPEGARDFIVPARLHPGKWYALPQSPQLFKQILMVAGCDRYLQICKCMRDEDPRADRQAEFTQIDLEMSFVEREDVMEMMTGFVRGLWTELFSYDIGTVERITYWDAMERYGIDRPDNRYGLELHDISAIAAKTDFVVFKEALEKSRMGRGGVVKAIRVPTPNEKITRKLLDGYSDFAKIFKAGGIPYTKLGANGFETGIAKFCEPIKAELIEKLGLKQGDIVVFAADHYDIATKTLGELRQKIARDLDIIPQGKWNFLWVIDFPMFEWDDDGKRWVALHHPFTSPNPDQFGILDKNPGACLSAGYDLVLNGSEIAGGSIRIHNTKVQEAVFGLIGLTEADAKMKFGFLLDALKHGAPPHGGIAFGLDRLIMHIVGTDNIRDVIAFPKTQSGMDLMSDAPGPVDPEQLVETHVRSTAPEQPAKV